MTVFERLAGVTDPLFRRLGGEAITLTPMRATKGDRVTTGTDPERPTLQATGNFILTSVMVAHSPVMEAEETGRRPGVAGEKWSVTLPIGSLAWRPRQGDRVTRDRSGERFMISKLIALDETWTALVLTGPDPC